MTFVSAIQSEILKTKRTASFWLSLIGAGFIPAIIFLVYILNPEESVPGLKNVPWKNHFHIGWQISSLLLPMYVILISTLIPQIEYRNHTWKQVFSSPQSTTEIYLAKFTTVHLMIISCLVLFNAMMILSAVGANLLNDQYSFFKSRIDWPEHLAMNLKTYIAIMAISAVQYWLSVRFKSFIVPIGIGLALLLGSIIATNLGWPHVAKIPHAHSLLTYMYTKKNGAFPLANHEWNALGYFLFFVVLGCIDLHFRKAKG